MRCSYSSTTDVVCRSQEVGDEVADDDGNFNMRGRLIRVEVLLAKLAEKMATEEIERGSDHDQASPMFSISLWI